MTFIKRDTRVIGNQNGYFDNHNLGLSRKKITDTSSFSPSQLSGLQLWLRSDLGVTLNGSTVSNWADQSGNSRDYTQPTSTNQPTYSSSDANFNSCPSIYFDGSNDNMYKSASALPNMSAVTIYMVVKLDSTVYSSATQVWQWGNSGGKAINLNGNGSSGQMQFWFSYPTISNKTVRVYSSCPTTTCYMTAKCQLSTANTSWATFVNGTSGGSNSSANNNSGATDTSQAAYMGSWNGGGGGYAKFYIAEFMIYDSVHSAANQTSVENYIKARYNL